MRSSIVRSAPPQKASLAEVTTAPLMAESVTTFSTMASSSAITSMVMTFIERSAMSQVTSAMPSASTSNLKFGMTLKLLWRIRLAVPVQIAAGFFVALHHQIDIRIMHALGFRAGADLEIDRVAAAAVDQAAFMLGLKLGGIETAASHRHL